MSFYCKISAVIFNIYLILFQIISPVLTKHCKLCVQCFNQMDHHCLFLYRCIAVDNHRLFVLLIMVVLVVMVIFQYVAFSYIQYQFSEEQWSRDLAFAIFHHEPMLWSAMIANALSVFWGVTLLNFQLKVISKGQTTFFQPNRGRTRFTFLQRFWNILLFLIGSKGYRKDPIILQNV